MVLELAQIWGLRHPSEASDLASGYSCMRACYLCMRARYYGNGRKLKESYIFWTIGGPGGPAGWLAGWQVSGNHTHITHTKIFSGNLENWGTWKTGTLVESTCLATPSQPGSSVRIPIRFDRSLPLAPPNPTVKPPSRGSATLPCRFSLEIWKIGEPGELEPLRNPLGFD